ncbi:ABC transporter substrate-binding protein [Chromobacterium violaceum]|uniref:ABC transporter substrate-binding protein n=1 Tax=Chromobacterium violaceum TaxID=536 RepID=UPI00385AED7C
MKTDIHAEDSRLAQIRVGFLPLTDCAPIAVACKLGLDRMYGLALQPLRQPSWTALRDRLLAGQLDAAHALYGLACGVQLGLGAGNGAVFQLVPQRFGRELGVMTGLVGMAGGIGGFLLAAGLGAVKQASGDYAPGLWLFAGLCLLAWLSLAGVQRHWRDNWAAAAARV